MRVTPGTLFEKSVPEPSQKLFLQLKFPLFERESSFAEGVLLSFRIQFIIIPKSRIIGDISYVFLIIFVISDNMIVETPLPYIFAVFFVTITFECRNKLRNSRTLSCRGRRPRRPVFCHNQHNMNMIWHNNIPVYANVIIKIIQFFQMVFRCLTVRCKFDCFRDAEDVVPYICLSFARL